MPIATDGRGLGAALRALASQIHPVFMLPPVAASLFGGLSGPGFSLPVATVHAIAVFCALYTAHVKDGYVDFYGRKEDDDHPLTASGCRVAMALSTLGFAIATVAVGLLVDSWAALLTLPGWLIGFHHAPQLDTNPVTATAGYPAGIAFALLGGYYVQSRTLTATILTLATVFLIVLSGIKVVDDATDYEYDRSIQKRTVAVVLGPARAHQVAFGLMGTGMAVVVATALMLPGVPPTGVLAAVAFGVVAVAARDADPELATKLLIRGSYVFLAVLVGAVWLRPLA